MSVVEEREIVDNEVKTTVPKFGPTTIVNVEDDVSVEPPDLYFTEDNDWFPSSDGELEALDVPFDGDDMKADEWPEDEMVDVMFCDNSWPGAHLSLSHIDFGPLKRLTTNHAATNN